MLKIKKEIALNAFQNGFNCAQSVLKTQKLILNFDLEQAMHISSGFGGGMGRLQKTCGAVSGAIMAIGFYNSEKIESDQERKEKTHEMIQQFAKQFKELNKSLDCGDLLGVDLNTEAGQKEFEEKELGKNVCHKCILDSLEILDRLQADQTNR